MLRSSIYVKSLIKCVPTHFRGYHQMKSSKGGRFSEMNLITPYSYNRIEAGKRFAKILDLSYLEKRSSTLIDNTNLPMVAREDPLKAIYLPYLKYESTIDPIIYEAEYGEDYEIVHYDNKGNPYVKTYTNWYNIIGTIKKSKQSKYFYGAYNYPINDVNKLLNKYPLEAIPYQEKLVDKDAIVDEFEMRTENAKVMALKHIKSKINYLIRKDIKRRVHPDHIKITNIRNYKITNFNIDAGLFPSYVLSYNKHHQLYYQE